MELIIKEIPTFNGYFADNEGNIYSSWRSGKGSKTVKNKLKKLRPGTWMNGYKFVNLRIAKLTYYSTGVHRLICLAFHGVPKNKNYEASHLDGSRINNIPDNLIWETRSDNFKRKLLHGTHDRGYFNKRAKINKEIFEKIKELLRAKKYTHKRIGEMFGLRRVFISKINSGYRYKGL